MMSNLEKSLLMTLIGMGLVFVGILLLWGLMALMVRVLPERRAKSGEDDNPQDDPADEIASTEDPAPVPDAGLRRRAAAAAVAVALAMHRTGAALVQPPVHQVSSWQAVLRANQLNQRLQMFNRKPRGSSR